MRHAFGQIRLPATPIQQFNSRWTLLDREVGTHRSRFSLRLPQWCSLRSGLKALLMTMDRLREHARHRCQDADIPIDDAEEPADCLYPTDAHFALPTGADASYLLRSRWSGSHDREACTRICHSGSDDHGHTLLRPET
jgi:hypothetical protein